MVITCKIAARCRHSSANCVFQATLGGCETATGDPWPTWSQCTSPVLHQVELLEALLNYYIRETLYPKVNGKNQDSFFPKVDSALDGEESWTGVGNQGSPEGCVTLGRSFV